MARTSPIHYIAPSAIAITPNANNSANDLAVYIAKGTKIKVCYQPIADLAYDDANIRQWTLKGRNRRLADASVPYTIYARLKKTDPGDGYLVFAPQTQDEATGEWQDPYILSPNTSATTSMRAEGADGNKYLWGAIPERQAAEGRSDYWWVRLGSVSLADTGGQRTVDLDTGTLGTDQYNKDWYLDPDNLPEHPVRVVYVERGEWTAKPMAEYTGPTGSAAPDGTLPAAVAKVLGWEGTAVQALTTGQEISEPYHCRSLTRCRWLTNRLSKYNAGYTDAELYEELTTPSSGWEEENWVETSRVWRDGRLWECMVDGATDVPSEASLQWKLLLQGGEDAYNVELTKSSDAAVIDPSGNVVGGYRTVSKDSSGNEFYTYRFHTSVTVMKGGEYLHLCGALDDGEELGDGNFTVEAIGAGCEVQMEGTTVYITYIWHCNDGDAGTDPYTSYNRTPEEYQLMRAMTEAVAHITLNIEGKSSVTKDYRLQLVHLPTDTVIIESHNEVAALNWSTKKNAWTNRQDIIIPLTASSGGQPVRFQTVNGGTTPDIRLLSQPGWLNGYSVAWADYDEDGDGHAEYTASQHMSVEITIPIANILRTWQEGGTDQEIATTNLLRFNVVTTVDGVEYENVVPFTLNVTTDKAIYVLVPSTKQVVGTMIGGSWDSATKTISNARYSYTAANVACNKVTCRLMSYDQNDQLTEITSASAIHDQLTFFINGAASTLEGFRTTGVENTPVGSTGHNLFDELSEIVFAVKMDGRDYESEGVPILRNGANLSVGDNGNWYIGGVDTEVFAKGTEVTGTFIYYTDPMDASTPPEYAPTASQRGKPFSPYLKTACPASVEGKFIHYVSITVFSDSEETYVYSYGTIGTGNTITVIHDRDYYASPSELTQAQLKAIAETGWSESTPANYSATNKYLYGRDTARYYKNGAEQSVTVGGIAYPKVVYALLSYWGQDGSGVEFAYYRADDDSAAKKPAVTVLNQRHAGTAKNPVIPDWSGADGGWYDDNPGFTAQGQVMYQSVNKYSNGIWSGWGDPVIIDRYAENPVHLDLDNEMDSFVEIGKTANNRHPEYIYTTARLYSGTDQVSIADWGIKKDSNSQVSAKNDIAYGTAFRLYERNATDNYIRLYSSTRDNIPASLTNNEVTYTFTAVYKGKEYYASIRIKENKNKNRYNIIISPSALSYNATTGKWNGSSSTGTLTVKVEKMDYMTATVSYLKKADMTAEGLTLKYYTAVGGTGTTVTLSDSSESTQVTVPGSADYMYFELTSSGYGIEDYETVPVARTSNGTDGNDGNDGNDGKDGKYEEKQYCRSAAKTSANGSTPPSDIDTSYGSSGWSTTPPATKVQYPFVWQRTHIYDPNTNTSTAWVYARVTGDTGTEGDQGKAGLWYSYAGVWGTDVTKVTNTDTQGWYVKYGDKWYMNVKDAGEENSNTPGGDGWEEIKSDFRYYIAEAYFGNYAHLGAFIINGDWMISQYGTLYNPSGGAVAVNNSNYMDGYYGQPPYKQFDPSYPNTSKSGTYNFCPNFAVDGKTGKVYMQNAYVQGEVHATSGEFNGTLHAQMMFSNVLFVSSTPYTINLASAPANIFYTAEQDYTINLPSAGLYNGLILRFIALCQPAAGHFAIKLHSNNAIDLRTKSGTGSFSTVSVNDIYTNNYVACSLISIGSQWHPLEGEFSSNSTYFFG